MSAVFALEREANETLSRIINSRPGKVIVADSFLDACSNELSEFCFSYRNVEQSGASLDDSYLTFLKARIRTRVQLLARFHSKLSTILARAGIGHGMHAMFLNGDSHNSAQRPVLLENANGRFVLKLTDPRTALIYNDIITAIQRGCGLTARTLQVDHDNTYRYQISPYLEHSNSKAPGAHEHYGYFGNPPHDFLFLTDDRFTLRERADQ